MSSSDVKPPRPEVNYPFSDYFQFLKASESDTRCANVSLDTSLSKLALDDYLSLIMAVLVETKKL